VLRSRRRLAFGTIALLLVFDLGRSLCARVGAATPTRLWTADPSYAQPIAWPPGTGLPADAALGARMYAQHCAVCHGPKGQGNGPAAPSLHPRPRDFTGGIFKLKSTTSNAAPTFDDVRETIRRGMPGTSMPAWRDLASDEEIDAVAVYVRSFGPHAQWAEAHQALAIPTDLLGAASAERGRQLYGDLGCASCHGREGRGDGSSAKDLKDVWNQPAPPRDLTAQWTFRSGNEPAPLYMRIANGVAGTPMPGYAEVATPSQIADVVAFIRSIARVPPWEPGGVLDGPGQSPDLVRRGDYLVHVQMCGLCHTPVDSAGIYLADTHYLAGGMKVEAGAHGIFFTRNLTADIETGLGTWSVDQIAAAIRSGHTRTRRLNYWGMPWMVLGALTSDDARAIASYLKTVPAVHNDVPLPLHYGMIETVVRKFSYAWPAVVPERLAYYAGNFGYERPTMWRRDLPQRLLIWAQLLVLGVAMLMWMFGRDPRGPDEERSLGLMLMATTVVLALGAALLAVYRYPALTVVPTESVVAAFGGSIPAVQTEGLPAHEAAMLQRGRYLYTISSCPYCHNGNGAGGGKVNWTVLGTTWARNLTAHPTGLADWSDDAVLRAMISGVARDGRALHWQAMIWDHLSNFAIEDQRALLAYVRTLPAVDHALPPPVAPDGNDCSGDTFWIGTTNFEPGCR